MNLYWTKNSNSHFRGPQGTNHTHTVFSGHDLLCLKEGEAVQFCLSVFEEIGSETRKTRKKVEAGKRK